jgi:DNA-binding GntR family transcriptional regulator
MVEQAAESIVAAAARGLFLPGDRLVEAEIARDLGISRVPVREALRLLESQAIVVSTPYKGMRLMQVTNAGVAALMRVRLSLEALAVEEAAARCPTEIDGQDALDVLALHAAAESYEEAARDRNHQRLVLANHAFHGELARLSGNAPLHTLWQSLGRQLLVVWGLAQATRDLAAAAQEHTRIVLALKQGDMRAARTALAAHIGWNATCDFEALAAVRRTARN